MRVGHTSLDSEGSTVSSGTDRATPKDQPLFRKEAIAARRTQWLGTVILARPLSYTFFAGFALVAAAAIVAFLIFGEFTRKASVKGWLVPQRGLVQVFAPQGGVIARVQTREGAIVKRGDVLMVVSAERQSAAGATQIEIGRLLDARRASLGGERRRLEQLLAQQSAALAARLDALRAESSQVSGEIDSQKQRVQLLEKSAERQRDLQQKGFITLQQAQEQQEQLLEQSGRLRALERSRLELEREIGTTRAELADMPLKAQTQIKNLERDISLIDQERIETEARREIMIQAPQDGVVTAILSEAGATAATDAPLLSIVPEGAQLEAHLFSPSRSVGFVEPGQNVLLRYEAYPYQKFGHHHGTVLTVSRAALTPTDLPRGLAGVSGLYGTNEPLYRIIVRLERQSITAYGKAQPLSPGMLLEADVVTDRRRLYEWLLDPLYTLTGRL
jgi:membrane fusion protein